jgi:FimV-like protein
MTQRFTLDALVRRPLAAITPVRGEALAAVLAFALAAGFVAPSTFAAEPAPVAAGASAGGSAAASAATPAMQMTVKPGQSLNDIAIAATQSHDKTVLGRAARAIFDANPAAFMRGDPSLMKLGAVLNVPPLDATGALVKAPAQPAAATPASVVAPSGTSKPAAGSGPAAASAPAANIKPAPAAPSAASASAAPASAAPSVPAAPRVQPAPAPTAAPAAQINAASQTGSASGHAWTGAIQPAPAPAAPQPSAANAASGAAASGVASVPGAVGASAPAGAAAPAATSMSAASGAAEAPAASNVKPTQSVAQPAVPVQGGIAGSASAVSGTTAASAAGASAPHVSSLQQLLTLKNRVLKEWQQRGFSSSAQRQGAQGGANNGAPAGGQGSVAAGGAMRPGSTADQQFVGFGGLGLTLSRATIAIAGAVVAAIVAVLVVLLGALLLGRRKRRALVGAADDIEAMPTKGEAGSQAPLTGLPPANAAQDPLEAEYLAALARTPTSKRALMGLAGHYAERRNISGFDEIAQRIWHLTGGRGPNWEHVAVLGRQLDPDNPLFAGAPEQAGDAVTSIGSAAQAAAQAEAGAPRAPESAQAPAAAARDMGAPPVAETQAVQTPAAPDGQAGAEPAAAAAQADERAAARSPSEVAEETESTTAPVKGEASAPLSEPAAAPESTAAANSESERLPIEMPESAAPEVEPAHAEAVASQPVPAAESPVEPQVAGEAADTNAAGAEALAPEGETAAPIEQGDEHAPPEAVAQAPHPTAEPLPEHRAEPAAAHPDEAPAEHPVLPTPASEPEQQLPADAVAALENLDMGLPPRAEPAHEVSPPSADDVEPADHPHAQVPQHDELDEDENEEAAARPVGETIEHGVAGPAAVAGLGAAPFGALNLSFDLDLPAGAGEPAQASPVPTFTPEQLAKIARNKLELASEYIALGDLGGARTLLHEVIESNDADTRDEAHALLATLAPLS